MNLNWFGDQNGMDLGYGNGILHWDQIGTDLSDKHMSLDRFGNMDFRLLLGPDLGPIWDLSLGFSSGFGTQVFGQVGEKH